MLKPSRKVLYAIEAVVDIAYHSGGIPVQSREITRRQGIPRRYLEQTLQLLVRHHILLGIRGPSGGYSLARERRRITVGEIARVVQDHENDDGKQYSDSELGQYIITPIWETVRIGILEKLDAITIDDLCQQCQDQNIVSEAKNILDFTI